MKSFILVASFLFSLYSFAGTGGYAIYRLPQGEMKGHLETIEQVYGENNFYGIKLVVETTNRKILLNYDDAADALKTKKLLEQGMSIDLSRCAESLLKTEYKDWSVEEKIECPKFGKFLPALRSQDDLKNQIAQYLVLGKIIVGHGLNE